jgi:hypothetical protein
MLAARKTLCKPRFGATSKFSLFLAKLSGHGDSTAGSGGHRAAQLLAGQQVGK